MSFTTLALGSPRPRHNIGVTPHSCYSQENVSNTHSKLVNSWLFTGYREEKGSGEVSWRLRGHPIIPGTSPVSTCLNSYRRPTHTPRREEGNLHTPTHTLMEGTMETDMGHDHGS